MYLSVCTRPDISYALSQLSQFNTAFTKDHWLAAKRILRYLSGTTDYGLVYVKTVYSDNQSALRLLEVKEYCHRKTKHIDIRYHFVKDLIKNNNVITEYMSTEHMIADVLTKPLSRIKHLSFVKELCLQKLGL
ncbi:unnamed protein product [Euphydryas editha]|uniref:Copia protein n=1 Tax=Euphydryas editha TaxID=104508 RepID=A0AAU9V0L6_EUPED|nr:unnamed protein product [Euphydryas editha]